MPRRALVLDTSGSMSGEPIRQLNAGLKTFRDELFADSLCGKTRGSLNRHVRPC
jgi:uncharacterized protein YegL